MLIFSGLLLVAQAEEATVRPSGVQVVWEDPKDEFGGFSLFNAMKPVSLALLVDAGDAALIEMDEDASKLISLKDDKGTDLKGEIWSFPKISEDGKLARVQVQGEKSPAKGARSIQASGKLVFHSASETETKKGELGKVAKGEKVVIGDDLKFEIKSAGKPQWGDEPFEVELEIKRDIPEVAAFRFYDKDGKEIESSEGANSRMGFLGKVTLSKSFRLEKKVEELRVEVDVWADLKTVEVPFEVEVGVGKVAD